MKRRIRRRLGVACLAAFLVGCSYSSDEEPVAPPPLSEDPTVPASRAGATAAYTTGAAPAEAEAEAGSEERKKRDAILENVIRLIQSARLKPGGENFGIAAENLNEYFERDANAADFQMTPRARQFLLQQGLPKELIASMEGRSFDARSDARHLEDCMFYQNIAARVGGIGDDLTRVQRLFAWMVQQVQLVPAQSLAPPGLPQAQARPFDALMRGMATENDGGWSERGWLFMVLCRQLGVDVGLLNYVPRGGGPNDSATWICAALVDKKAYLFDARLGLPIPGPGGQGVATLGDVLADPTLLARLDLPNRPYGTTSADLLASPGKVGVLIDSGRGGLSPKMRLLQRRLAGKNRTILYRDPADQADRFAEALGARYGGTSMWRLPIQVEELLFTDPRFVEATMKSQALLSPELPLLYARAAQLRGELDDAKLKYATFRKVENGTMLDGKTPMPPGVQEALDIYATYFLALCHLELGNVSDAELFLRETLRLTPEPGPGRPYSNMLRWGAQSNLGRIYVARDQPPMAISYLSESDPTYQGFGNSVIARDLIWSDPFTPLSAPLPPPPPPAAPRGAQAAASSGVMTR